MPKVSVTLKLGPRPAALEAFPCCLCVSMSRESLLRVHDPPIGKKDTDGTTKNPIEWMAHEECANVVPETWIDEIDVGKGSEREKVVFGGDAIVKDRWNLVSCVRFWIEVLHLTHILHRNARRVRRFAPRLMELPFNVQKVNVRRPSMSLVRGMGKKVGLFLLYYGKSRRRSCYLILELALQSNLSIPCR
jgi:hypothetical protein